MTHHNPVHLRGRGDPRALAEYAALHAEISKLTHPARPEPDWLRIENLCTVLFIRNGTDLQTAAWFTLALSHQYGPEGLRDGLKVMESQVVTCRDTLWPPNTADRTDILTSLFRRLQRLLRTWDLSQPALLMPLYHCEKYLSMMDQALGEAGLKAITGVGELNASVKRALCRLEARAETQSQLQMAGFSSAGEPPVQDTACREPLVMVMPAESDVVTDSSGPSFLRSFLAGAAATLAAVFLVGGLWYHGSQGDAVFRLLDATMPPVPHRLTEDEQRAVQRDGVQAEAWISRMEQHAEALDTAETGLAGGYSTRLAL